MNWLGHLTNQYKYIIMTKDSGCIAQLNNKILLEKLKTEFILAKYGRLNVYYEYG